MHRQGTHRSWPVGPSLGEFSVCIPHRPISSCAIQRNPRRAEPCNHFTHYRATQHALSHRYGTQTAKMWFTCMQPTLNSVTPANGLKLYFANMWVVKAPVATTQTESTCMSSTPVSLSCSGNARSNLSRVRWTTAKVSTKCSVVHVINRIITHNCEGFNSVHGQLDNCRQTKV